MTERRQQHEEDLIDVVVHQTGCARSDAEQALKLHPGDVVSAIMHVSRDALMSVPSYNVTVSPQMKEAARVARETLDAIEKRVRDTRCSYYQAGEALGLAGDDSLMWQLAIRDSINDLWFSDETRVKRRSGRHG